MAANSCSESGSTRTDAGLLTRTANDETPPRVEYTATEKARKLALVFWYLGVWTDRHDLEPAESTGDRQ